MADRCTHCGDIAVIDPDTFEPSPFCEPCGAVSGSLAKLGKGFSHVEPRPDSKTAEEIGEAAVYMS